MFFGAFLGPIFAILLFNIVIFVIVIAVLIKHGRKKLKREVDQEKTKTIIRLMLSIAGVISIYGLAWVFGALTVVSRSRFVFQVLFAIFNSLQGFMIFLFFCVVSRESRELWTQLFCRGKTLDRFAPFKARKSYKRSVGNSRSNATYSTGDRSKTSSLLPSGREREASLSIVKANPVAHELSILEEEPEKKMETSLPYFITDELQSETTLLAVETIFFESDPTMQAQESSVHDEGQMGLIDIDSSDEQGGADGVADATINGNASDVILEVVINQHAEDD